MPAPLHRLLGRICPSFVALVFVSAIAAASEQGISLVATPPSLPVLPEPAPDLPPRVLNAVAPECPFALNHMGRVDLEVTVDAKGRVLNPYVLRSSNPWLERPAIEAVLKWSFEPAVKNGLPVAARVRQSIEFDPTYNYGHPGYNFVGSPWRAKKVKGHDKLPLDIRWDEAPQPLASTYPAFPLDALLAEKSGRATIQFRINPYGIVVAAEVTKAKVPEFGRAALASIDEWRFTPARREGAPCSAVVTMTFEFDPISGGDVPVSPGMKQVARELRRKPARLQEFAQLDRAPQSLSQRPPVYPSALRPEGQPGTAVIEYYLDKNGDAQLPHVVSASRPEFGYAAAQAVACWRFAQPTRDGRAVIARCRASFSFFAPSGPDSTGDASVIIGAP